jgi:hypothetical protein
MDSGAPRTCCDLSSFQILIVSTMVLAIILIVYTQKYILVEKPCCGNFYVTKVQYTRYIYADLVRGWSVRSLLPQAGQGGQAIAFCSERQNLRQ